MMRYNENGPGSVGSAHRDLAATSILRTPGDVLTYPQSTEPVPLRQCLADVLVDLIAIHERPQDEVA